MLWRVQPESMGITCETCCTRMGKRCPLLIEDRVATVDTSRAGVRQHDPAPPPRAPHAGDPVRGVHVSGGHQGISRCVASSRT